MTKARTLAGVVSEGSPLADGTISAADVDGLDTSLNTKLPLAGGTMTGPISFAAEQTWPTFNQNTTGSAATLATGRTIGMTGDVTWTSGSFNGSANVTGTATLANSGVTAGTYTKVTVDAKGRATSGTTLSASDIPNLDASKITSGTLDAARLPSYVDDVLEYANLTSFPASGETGKIYVALDTNKTYRWSGSTYVYITSGAVDSVAGKTGVVTLTSSDVGLGNVENKSSATIRSELTSSNVTTALGFTPYNSTNPSGYITSAALSSYLPLAGGTVTGVTTFSNAGDAQVLLNGGGTTWAGISWTDSGGTDYTWFNGSTSTFAIGGGGSVVSGKKLHINGGATIGANYGGTSNPTNGLNVEGAIQQGGNQVLHAGNYTSYSPSLTGSGASGTWGISVTGSAGSAGSVSGLTLTSSANGINPDNVTQNQLGYNTSVSLFGQTDGGLYSSAYSQSWVHQIYGDFRTGQIAVRGKNSGTWQSWRTVLDSGNYTSYAVGVTNNSTLNSDTRNTRGVTRLYRRDDNSDYSVQTYWTGSYWRLYGYSGDSAHADTQVGLADNSSLLQGYQWASSGKDVRAQEFYVDGWFRNYNSGTGLYNQATANHFYSDGQYWNVGYSGTTGIRLRNGHGGTILGYLYAETSGNFGLLYNGGGWAVQVYPGGGGYLHGTWNGSNIRAQRANGNFYIDDNYGCGIVGAYASTRYQGVFAMGDSYKLPADGTTTGSLYGMAWSHPNAGGVAGNLDSHGMIVMINGGFGSCMSYSIKASGNVTAYSDERLKTNWRSMPTNYVARLAQVKVGIYDRTDNERLTQVGVSAQSFQELLPQAITVANDEIGTLSVSYGNAALASAVELAKDNVELRARIERLEALVEQLLNKE